VGSSKIKVEEHLNSSFWLDGVFKKNGLTPAVADAAKDTAQRRFSKIL